MKTAKLLAVILIVSILAASIAAASIKLTPGLMEKFSGNTRTNIAVQPAANKAPAESQLALENQFAEEDLAKIEIESAAGASYVKPISIASRWKEILTRPVRVFIPREGARYGIELSGADRANPLFASVSLRPYQDFQRSNPAIFEQMVWANDANSAGKSIVYSQQQMEALTHYIALLEANQPFPVNRPPEGHDVPAGSSTRKYYSENEALNMWLPHIALSLYVEANHLVPWSLTSYGSNELGLLLDGRKFINYYPDERGYTIYMTRENGGGMQGVTDWNAFNSFKFLQDNGMIKPTQEETIYAFTQWIRENVFHEAVANSYAQQLAYGYNGSYPVDKVLNPPSGQKHWTVGCFGTVSLYKALLHTVNIPVSMNFSLGGHTAPVFKTANLALMHGDDPYGTYNRRGTQETPVEDIFVSVDEFYAMNHAAPEPYNGYIPNEAEMANYLTSKRQAQNAFDNMAYTLLKKRGEDVLYYLPAHIINGTLGYWWASEGWRPLFAPEDIARMFTAMDAEITSIGGGDFSRGNLLICRGLNPRPDYC